MNKYAVEFIGTLLFVTVIVTSVAGTAGGMAPLAIGSALMVMVYAGGHISGGHFNPAVTLGATLRGAASMADLPGYWVSQLAGGAVGALLGRFLVSGMADPAGFPSSLSAAPFGPAILAEFLGTFALVWVVLNVATAKGTEGNSFYGLAIGFTVLAFAFGVGAVSGGAFNPAVALGVMVAGLSSWANIAMYWIGQLAAGAAAAFAFNALNPKD